MAKVSVLIEVAQAPSEAFGAFALATESEADAVAQAESILEPLAGLAVDVDDDLTPVPMFLPPDAPAEFEESLRLDAMSSLTAFSSAETNPDLPASTTVVPAQCELSALEQLQQRDGVWVWPNSPIQLLGSWDLLGTEVAADAALETPGAAGDELAVAFDLARSRPGTDCRPFRPGVPISTIRALLGVRRVWDEGFRGQNIVVGILDEGVDGSVYPVTGGLRRPGAPLPGTAAVTSHGSMCAADILIAAPSARLYDYPFLGQPRSGGAIASFQAVLDQRRLDGTPHLTNNSYGFTGVPPKAQAPNHEIHDLNHPLHRKVREVIASGAAAFFAAGNCGRQCPSLNCQPSGIGPGQSIHASNSLREVITIAAVNSRHERIGYSSQGPGMFEPEKPDLACYSHMFGNFGPGRPGGTAEQAFDNGTSAATPAACGVGALLLSAFPDTSTARLKAALVAGAGRVVSAPWDPDYGRGVVNAAAAYRALDRGLV
jgi:serine protease AprX